ncbi:hypothetical protein ONZ45_g12270 [Pleurotus djamor]|nr:hypothetical protein ONZ45_g12270 [Pleurotus djamor]
MSSSSHQHRAPTRINGSSSRRPASIAELAERALDNPWEEGKPLKYYLRVAEKCRRDGKEFMQKGDLEDAFVQFARAATLVLEKIPSHREYHDVLTPAHRQNLGLNGQDILDHLSNLKPSLVERYEKWIVAHPNWDPAQESEEQQQQQAEAEMQRRIQVEADEWKRQRDPPPPQPQREERIEQPKRQTPAISNAPDYTFSNPLVPPSVSPRPPQNEPFDYARMNAQLSIDGKSDRHQQEQDEMRRRQEEITRRRAEDRRREEQAGIAQRQYEAEAAARAARQGIPTHNATPLAATASAPSVLGPSSSFYPPNPPPPAPSSSFVSRPPPTSVQYPAMPSTSSSLHTPMATTSRPPSFLEQFPTADAPLMMPLESPTKYEGDSTDSETLQRQHDWRRGKQRHIEAHRTPTRPVRSPSYPPPITTTSPPPAEGQRILYPQLMSPHQKKQGYVPSLHSMFIPPTGSHIAPSTLLFESNTTPNAAQYNNRVLYADFLPPQSVPQQQQHTFSTPTHYLPPTQHYQPPQPQHQPHAAPSPAFQPPPEPSRSEDRIIRNKARSDAPELKTINLPRDCLPRFLAIAKVNTELNRETCGLLLGKDKGHKYVVTTLLVPKQHSTSDTCTMDEEELVLQFTEERSLITLGWIHTHPSQSCFMSSVDLHTHSGFQRMLPESFAVVCAPKSKPNFGIFRLTDPPGLKTILDCTAKEAFHPHPDLPIYTDADKGHVQMKDINLEIAHSPRMRPAKKNPILEFISQRRWTIFLVCIVLAFMQAGFFSGHRLHRHFDVYPDQIVEEWYWASQAAKWLRLAETHKKVLTEHPIPKLMDEAEEKFRQKVGRQSKTLQAAVAEYKRRYDRNPPKGFDKWWEFAVANNVTLVDEYDGLMKDLAPFYKLSGIEVKRRAEQVGQLPSIDLLRLRGGKPTMVNMNKGFVDSEVSARAHGFRRMIEKFQHLLPDLDFPINAKAEGRVLVPWEHQRYPNLTKEDSSNGIEDMLGGPFPPDWRGIGNVWEAWRRTCPPDSAARRLFSSLRNTFAGKPPNYLATNTTPPGNDFSFVPTTASTFDFCQKPYAHYTQGHFFSDWRTIPVLYPVFSPATTAGYLDIRIPSHYYYGSTKRYTYGWDPVNMQLKDVDDMEKPWEEKADIIFWRGASTGGGSHPPGFSHQYQRHRFLRMTSDESETNRTITFEDPPGSKNFVSVEVPIVELNDEVMDAAFVKITDAGNYPGGIEEMKKVHRMADAVPLGTHWSYKYLIDLDGMGYSGRFMSFLASDSAALKSTIYDEYYSDWIQPWVHFIPVSPSYRELYNIHAYFSGPSPTTIEFANASHPLVSTTGGSVEGDRRLRRIARAGKQWKKTIGRTIDMEVYVFRLCLEWARLCSEHREDMDFTL